MSPVAGAALLTAEDLLALPEDGVERWLIRGQLREKPMTKRNRWHARLTARISTVLNNWRDQQPPPRGEVLDGEAGCLLQRNPDTTVGIDVVYIPPELAAQDPEDTTLIDGPPTLAVEVLSPNDTVEEIDEKLDNYLAAGVAVVWIVHAYARTVTVYRPSKPPEMFNTTHELSGDPELPDFRVAVAHIFDR